ncbi:MAG: NFACT family protein, partial [Armatimonadota bacterium]
TEEGDFVLVGEFMGKHSNFMLVDTSRKVVAAAKWVGAKQSKRPILPGKDYTPPPFPPRPSFLTARPGDDLKDFEGVSPILQKLVASGVPLEELQNAVTRDQYLPVLSPGLGAYPWTLESLGLPVVSKTSISQALDQAFTERVEQARLDAARNTLRSRLERVLLAREVALNDLDQAVMAAQGARGTQIKGELILAYQGMVRAGDSTLTAWDHSGEELAIKLDPKLNAVENAERYFSKARRAK